MSMQAGVDSYLLALPVFWTSGTLSPIDEMRASSSPEAI